MRRAPARQSSHAGRSHFIAARSTGELFASYFDRNPGYAELPGIKTAWHLIDQAKGPVPVLKHQPGF
jgi:hypothetical protein